MNFSSFFAEKLIEEGSNTTIKKLKQRDPLPIIGRVILFDSANFITKRKNATKLETKWIDCTINIASTHNNFQTSLKMFLL